MAEAGFALPRSVTTRPAGVRAEPDNLQQPLDPCDIDGLDAAQRRRIYGMLRIEAAIGTDGSLEVCGDVISVNEYTVLVIQNRNTKPASLLEIGFRAVIAEHEDKTSLVLNRT